VQVIDHAFVIDRYSAVNSRKF